jgi:hypothetical protein
MLGRATYDIQPGSNRILGGEAPRRNAPLRILQSLRFFPYYCFTSSVSISSPAFVERRRRAFSCQVEHRQLSHHAQEDLVAKLAAVVAF